MRNGPIHPNETPRRPFPAAAGEPALCPHCGARLAAAACLDCGRLSPGRPALAAVLDASFRKLSEAQTGWSLARLDELQAAATGLERDFAALILRAAPPRRTARRRLSRPAGQARSGRNG